jgi:hypothetical protein
MNQAITRKFFLSQKFDQYIAAFIDNRECLIELDEASKNLELGEHILQVENTNVKIDTVKKQFKCKLQGLPTFKLIADDPTVVVSLKIERFNKNYISACRNAGGLYCNVTKQWSFKSEKQKEIFYLKRIYESEERVFEIDISNALSLANQTLDLLGYPVARYNPETDNVQLSPSLAIMQGQIVVRGDRDNKFVVANSGTVVRVLMPHLVVQRSGNKKYIEI